MPNRGRKARIIAIDNQEWKLELAKKVGATDGVLVGDADARKTKVLRNSPRGGVDYCFEAIGITDLVTAQSVQMIKKGGTAVSSWASFRSARWSSCRGSTSSSPRRSLIGSMMGSNCFRIDMPRYVEFYLSGQLKLDEMISARMPLDDINTAFEEMKKGAAARSVITFD